jgi:hypothetical protein
VSVADCYLQYENTTDFGSQPSPFHCHEDNERPNQHGKRREHETMPIVLIVPFASSQVIIPRPITNTPVKTRNSRSFNAACRELAFRVRIAQSLTTRLQTLIGG